MTAICLNGTIQVTATMAKHIAYDKSTGRAYYGRITFDTQNGRTKRCTHVAGRPQVLPIDYWRRHGVIAVVLP